MTWKLVKDDNFIQSEGVRARISDWPVTRSTDVGADQRNNNAEFIALANPVTILELCTLLEKAEDAMITARDAARCTDSWAYEALDEPLAAIKQWKEQT